MNKLINKEIYTCCFTKDHILSPFVYKNHSTEFSITEHKTSIWVKSIFISLLTLPLFGLGGLVAFYYLTAKHKVMKKSSLPILVEGNLSVRVNPKEELTTKGGQTYKKIEWNTTFEKELYFLLNDLDKAVQIHSCYQQHLLPLLVKEEERNNVEQWIKENGPILGNRVIDYIQILEKNDPLKTLLSKYKKDFQNFFNAVGNFAKPVDNPPLKPGEKIRVVTITTNGGGGHLMVAQAIDSFFKRNPTFDHTICNVNENDKRVDPYSIYTDGALSDSEIYDEVFQKQSDPAKARALWDEAARVKEYIPNYVMKDVIDRIRALKPHFIISTRHFAPHDIRAMYELNVPGAFVHCDYDISCALIPWARKVSKNLVNFLLPSIDPEVKKPVGSMLKAGFIGNEQAFTAEQLEKMEKEADEVADTMFEPFGYPVRLSFNPEKNPQILSAIRTQFCVNENEKVVLMVMGRQGVGKEMPELIKKLLCSTEDFDQPVRLFAVCGKNEPMKEEIRSLIKSMPRKKNITIDVFGYLEEKKMAQLTQIGDLYVGKPGGATTAELIAVGLPVLLTSFHLWEAGNKNHLKRQGLLNEMETKELFPKQLKDLLMHKKKTHTFNDIDWKDHLERIVLQGIQRHTLC